MLETGKAETFNSLAKAVFDAMKEPVDIEYVDMPPGLKERYQYRTEAEITKLCESGYNKELCSLDEGVKDYVQNYLDTRDSYL